ncbi:hypothetical protein CC1G_10169 [Coprinopsis cinerea okayama7|uniref:Uncharacterized protein n=1 Tax=Coprinopsis cinerea (strain Okayama-7 / 130 / ATCC MYA-4618 / FGSC 9003) TaxID=240176 RepID=A8PEH3_COPC7|nr:hypothetical protein CC1G_10169 [Coprinopsis cinerea okayama7\|eukprot:XP_001840795.2 hypothetical protein CC1G_10169 [Coprinopsis cinerea okayama7\
MARYRCLPSSSRPHPAKDPYTSADEKRVARVTRSSSSAKPRILQKREIGDSYLAPDERVEEMLKIPFVEILSPVEVRCILCDQSIRLDARGKSTQTTGLYAYNLKKHIGRKKHQFNAIREGYEDWVMSELKSSRAQSKGEKRGKSRSRRAPMKEKQPSSLPSTDTNNGKG